MRTPARTPATGGNRVLQEAQNLRALQSGQTPLLGGENPDLHPSDFSGITPRATPSHTPNPLAAAAAAVGATPSHGGRAVAGVAATPQLGGGVGATPGRAVAGVSATPSLLGSTPGRGGVGGATQGATPMRDALGLNDPDAWAAMPASKREEAARLALQRNELRAGLSQLPQPKNEYQIVVPELPGEWGGCAWAGCLLWCCCFVVVPLLTSAADVVLTSCCCFALLLLLLLLLLSCICTSCLLRTLSPHHLPAPLPSCSHRAEVDNLEDGFEEDAADREARRKAAAEAARLAELRKRSNVMQRGLPRPAALSLLPQPRPDAQVGGWAWWVLQRGCNPSPGTAEHAKQSPTPLPCFQSLPRLPPRPPDRQLLPFTPPGHPRSSTGGCSQSFTSAVSSRHTHGFSPLPPIPSPQLDRLSQRELAEELLQREYAALISYEAAKHPVKVGGWPSGRRAAAASAAAAAAAARGRKKAMRAAASHTHARAAFLVLPASLQEKKEKEKGGKRGKAVESEAGADVAPIEEVRSGSPAGGSWRGGGGEELAKSGQHSCLRAVSLPACLLTSLRRLLVPTLLPAI